MNKLLPGNGLFQQCRCIKFKHFWPLSPNIGGFHVILKQVLFDNSGIPKISPTPALDPVMSAGDINLFFGYKDLRTLLL